MDKDGEDHWRLGGILCVLGLVVLVSSHDLVATIFLLGLGNVFMASSEEHRERMTNFYWSLSTGLARVRVGLAGLLRRE